MERYQMLGALLGAAGGVLGSIFNNNSAKKQMQQQVRFAKNGIQWKVEDATKAGLHPLAALGANTMSYSPVQVGDISGPLSDMGQNVGRAVQAAGTDSQRAIGAVDRGLMLERAGLENDLLRSQIASENAKLRAQLGPPMPAIAGMSPEIVTDPKRTSGVNMGVGIKTNPYFSDAQTYEDRYGELGGSALGLANIPADLIRAWLFTKRPSSLKGSRVPGRYQAK